MSSTIPHRLIEQIKAGNVILFLGAGASYGTKNPSGDKMPMGKELGEIIVNKFLGESYKGTDLALAADLAIASDSLYEFQKFISEIIKPFQAQPYHLRIASFKWKAIYTTNYDLILEDAYERAAGKLQDLRPIMINEPKEHIFINERILPYYKLHGCLTRIADERIPLIFTVDQFINHQKNRDNLFKELQEHSQNYTILFVGFGMADTDIRIILNNLHPDNNMRTRSYIIGPDITDLFEKMWDSRKVSTIRMSFEEFIKNIDNTVPSALRKIPKITSIGRSPILDNFQVSFEDVKPSTDFEDYLENKMDFIHVNLNAENRDAKQFYKGYFDNWDPIIKNLDFKRSILDGVLTEIFLNDSEHSSDRQFLHLITGNGGSGKSVFLKRIAFDGAVVLGCFCIFVHNGKELKYDFVHQLCLYSKQRVYIFIDNIAKCEDEIIYILGKSRKDKLPITIVGGERGNVWDIECQTLSSYINNHYQLEYLKDIEISALIDLLDKHKSLGTLNGLSKPEQIKSFEKRAGRELLVALYEATNGSKPFEEIIFDEYTSIGNIKAQSMYLTISIFHRLGTYARAGIISRIHDISFSDFKDHLFRPLKSIVFDFKNYRINEYVYHTRNRLIANVIFEKVLITEQDRFDEYSRLIKFINTDYESDRIALSSIINAKKLIEVFPDTQKIRQLFDIAEEYCNINTHFLQQRAIFEKNSSNGSLIKAETFIKEAIKMDAKDPILYHTQAEILLEKAVRSKLETEYNNNLDSCISLCRKIIKDFPDRNSYPYHTILKANLSKLKKIFEVKDVPSIERAIKDIEKTFSIAKQKFINEQFLLETESTFNQIINQTDNARELLEQAFQANISSPFVALRLANFYEKENNFDQALTVVGKALDAVAGDKDLHHKYAMLLNRAETPNYEQIIYHLRRAFTNADSRYQSQYWYARSLYIYNKFEEAEIYFNQLSKAAVSPELKSKPYATIKKDDSPVIFEGVIKSIEASFGFVKQDETGHDIYFYRYGQINNNEISWNRLTRESKVRFNIAFNYRGPIAIKLAPRSS